MEYIIGFMVGVVLTLTVFVHVTVWVREQVDIALDAHKKAKHLYLTTLRELRSKSPDLRR